MHEPNPYEPPNDDGGVVRPMLIAEQKARTPFRIAAGVVSVGFVPSLIFAPWSITNDSSITDWCMLCLYAMLSAQFALVAYTGRWLSFLKFSRWL